MRARPFVTVSTEATERLGWPVVSALTWMLSALAVFTSCLQGHTDVVTLL